MPTYPPYSEHWIRDVGSFMLGLAAVLVLAGFTAIALTVAFGGSAVGSWFHFTSHLLDRSSSVNGTRDAVLMGVFAVTFTALAVAARRAERSG